ncbi:MULTISPECIES: DUF1028 domain-containing protein [Actinoalloteichus]|uniref:DUF1028 domain-containing protein n=1 Tax=Actinoalloteichus fjordicus TaxID=1612552 RepID=A0AAC9LFW7_9PSEU|nr:MULTISPECIES: DUF1028 domain-containing protein [Actinoalloteichus]APU16125.1 hypothetical protein UA74_20500 [Actinoalloteichus fjordicus]APU22188.1 hypothetical protein UA75_20995 [Actinoalloteichus sp. GBA129-24]
MTFSLAAFDADTGAFGMVICSSSPAVAARCLNLRVGVGAAASQNVTDPRLGRELLDQLEAGRSASEAIDAVTTGRVDIEYRQLTVLDRTGHAAAYSGARSLGSHQHAVGPGAVAAGNMLASPATVTELLHGYLESEGAGLEDRLLSGLRAAMAAGGEEGPVHAAGLAVVTDVAWPVTDLRVDYADDPVTNLTTLWDRWRHQRDDYRLRALNPGAAPSYGVPGDR